MSQVLYLVIAIFVLIALLTIFIVSFIVYRRTPAPKGCENMKVNEENCSSCSHAECSFYKGKNKE